MSENSLTHVQYNLVDVNGNVLEENVSHEKSLELINNSINSGFSYYYYPLDEAVLAQLVQQDAENNATEIRFFKQLAPIEAE